MVTERSASVMIQSFPTCLQACNNRFHYLRISTNLLITILSFNNQNGAIRNLRIRDYSVSTRTSANFRKSGSKVETGKSLATAVAAIRQFTK